MAMRKGKIGYVVLMVIIFFLAGWSPAFAKMQNVTICENQGCTVLTDSYDKEELLVKIFNLVKKNKNKEIALFEAYPENRMRKEKGIYFLMRRSLQEFTDHWNAVVFTDVLQIDHKRLKFHFKILPKSSTSYDAGSGELSIGSDNAIEMNFKNTFLVISGHSFMNTRNSRWVIDYVNFDNKTFGAYYYSSAGGSVFFGFSEGYQILKLSADDSNQEETPYVTAKSTHPDTPVQRGKKTGPPALSVSATINKSTSNVILASGDEVILKIEIENKGGSTAQNVQITMSGHKELVGYLGERKPVGDILAGERKVIELRAVLPAKIPQETASFTIDIKEGIQLAPSGTKTFKLNFLAEGF